MQSPKVQKYWEEGIARWGEQGDESGNVGRAWTGRALNARQGVGPHVQQMNSMLRSKYVQRNPTDTSPGWEQEGPGLGEHEEAMAMVQVREGGTGLRKEGPWVEWSCSLLAGWGHLVSHASTASSPWPVP